MFKKVLIAFLILILIAVFTFLTLKDYLLKAYIIDYAKNSLKSTCTIGRVRIFLQSIKIENLSFSNKGVDSNFKNINIQLDLSKITTPGLAGLELNHAVIKIKDLQKLMDLFAAASGPGRATAIPSFSFKLNDISIKSEKAYDIKCGVIFSLQGKIENNNISLDDIEVSEGNIEAANFKLRRITLKKYLRGRYKLNIADAVIVSKEFKNIAIPLKTKINKIIFPRAKNILFGPQARLAADLGFDGKFTYLNAGFQSVSFENIISIVAGEDNANIRGLFDGDLALCWQGDKLVKLRGDFRNDKGGFINLNKDTALDFMKNYLDVPSYKALVDNLKNYEYNIGELTVSKEEDTISFKMNFNSEKMGRRNITVNIHTENR